MPRILIILFWIGLECADGLAQSGPVIMTVAGGGPNNRAATSIALGHSNAIIDHPAVDREGNLFFHDYGGQRIFKVDPSGQLTLFAGDGVKFPDFPFLPSLNGDGGPALDASILASGNLEVDAQGNLFFLEFGPSSRIRRVDARTRIITTVAGGGECIPRFCSVEGRLATDLNLIEFGFPFTVDATGNIFIYGSSGDIDGVALLRFDAVTGRASTVAKLFFQGGMAADNAGHLFICDFSSLTGADTVRRIDIATGAVTHVAGKVGCFTSSGDGGPATEACLQPLDVDLDSAGNLLIASGRQIRRIDAATGIITTVLGGLAWCDGIAVEPNGDLLFMDTPPFKSPWADVSTHIRRFDFATSMITTVVGNGKLFPDDGYPKADSSLSPVEEGMVVDAFGNIFIADAYARILRIDAITGAQTTVAGTGFYTDSLDGEGGNPLDDLGDGGPANKASLFECLGLALDTRGNLFIADFKNNRIRRVDAVSGIITTVAGGGDGVGPGFDGDGGPSLNARLEFPETIALDDRENLFICQHNERVRRVDAQTGVITTVAGGGTIPRYGIGADRGDGHSATDVQLAHPAAMVVDHSRNLFIAEPIFGLIRRVDLSTGIITTLTGDAPYSGTPLLVGDGGPVANASGIAADGYNTLAVDVAGNLYSAAYSRVRRIDAVTGVVTSVAGTGTIGFRGDGGPPLSAQIAAEAIAINASGFYIYEGNSSRIRFVNCTANCPGRVDPTDLVPPNTTVQVSPAPSAAGWNNSDVGLTFTATDTQGGVGVKQINYDITVISPDQPFNAQRVDQNFWPLINPFVDSSFNWRFEGISTFVYFATDFKGNSEAPKTITIRIDKTPPVISGAAVDKPVLWPPDHRMVDVVVNYSVTDISPVTSALTVTSNEGESGDWQIVDAHHVRLLAERSSDGNGRVYTITIRSVDSAGNSSNQIVQVRVPHDQGG